MDSSTVVANGIALNILSWTPTTPRPDLLPVVLVHGFLDAANTWSPVAEILKDAGYTVLAPDLRGFGDSGRVGAGGYYHFPDYVADLAHWTEQALPNQKMLLVGHSMGGTVATLFASTLGERVHKLALLEGLGPPETPPEMAPLRMRRWIADLTKHRARGAEQPMTEDEAFARLKGNHARVADDILRPRMRALVRGNDKVTWAFDPLHRTTSPMPFQASMHRAFASEIGCPVLYVSGGKLGYHPPDEDERLTAFRSLTRFELPEAGHMMHWTEPNALASVLLTFFG